MRLRWLMMETLCKPINLVSQVLKGKLFFVFANMNILMITCKNWQNMWWWSCLFITVRRLIYPLLCCKFILLLFCPGLIWMIKRVAAAAWPHTPLLRMQRQIWWAAHKVLLICFGDLRSLGWVTGSAAKVSYERIMWYWERFHKEEYTRTLKCCTL